MTKAVLYGILALLGVTIAHAMTVAPPFEGANLAALFVTHRHGARMPQPSSNATAICGSQCGMLVPEGRRMLKSLGATVRAEYGEHYTFDTAGTALGTAYDPNRIVSHSTDVDRCLQSADAFVRGLFPADPDLSPTIHTKANENNKELLAWTSWASLLVHGVATNDVLWHSLDKFTVEDAKLSIANLREIGEAESLAQICPLLPFQCALSAHDILESTIARGLEAQHPVLMKYRSKLLLCLEQYNSVTMYVSAPKDAFYHAVGAKGFYLTQQMASDADNVLNYVALGGTDIKANAVFREYSGHDITVMPLAEALGWLDLNNPSYGAAIAIEVWALPNATAETAPVVRARYGEPKQNATDPHRYHYDFRYRALFGLASGSSTSFQGLAEQGVDFTAWKRFIAARGPASDRGTCWVEVFELQAMQCDPGCQTDRKLQPPNAVCQAFRGMCPVSACVPPSLSLSQNSPWFLAPDLSCRRVTSTRRSLLEAPLLPNTATIVAIGSALGGVVVACLAIIVLRWRFNRLFNVTAVPATPSMAPVAAGLQADQRTEEGGAFVPAEEDPRASNIGGSVVNNGSGTLENGDQSAVRRSLNFHDAPPDTRTTAAGWE